MSPLGTQRRFGPRRWYDRSTPESRPSSGNVRFLGVEVPLPRTADAAGQGLPGPVMTLSGHSGGYEPDRAPLPSPTRVNGAQKMGWA